MLELELASVLALELELELVWALVSERRKRRSPYRSKTQ